MIRLPSLVLLLPALALTACRTSTPVAPAAPAATSIAIPATGRTEAAPRWTTAAAPATTGVPARVAVRRAVRPTWSGSVEAAALSRYVWRGALLVDDPVLQPAATVAYGGLSLNVWGNLDLGDANDSAGELTEVNLTLQYRHAITDGAVPAAVFGGAIWYTSPSGWFDDLAEVYVGVSADTLLKPTLTVYVGVLEVEGLFGTFEIGHDVRLGCGMLELGAGISAGDHHFHGALFGRPVEAFGELFVDAGWAVTRGRFTLTPKVRFSTLVDGRLRDAQAKNDLFVFLLHAALAL